MGWRATLRSIEAANNRARKERERNERAAAKENAKLQKKLAQIAERRDKITEALKNEVAAGKVTSEQYAALSTRMADVTDELLVFGKTAAVTLGKRYACGKIEKPEFEQLRAELVPKQLYEERERSRTQVAAMQQAMADFKKSCSAAAGACGKCAKPKGFFRRLREANGMTLCGGCTRAYDKLKHYAGFQGTYIVARPCEVKESMTVSMSIRPEWF